VLKLSDAHALIVGLDGVHAFIGSTGAHALIGLIGARSLMREDELVKPAGFAGGPIKDLRVSNKLFLSLVTEILTEPSIVFGGTQSRSHMLRTLSQLRIIFYVAK